jgi:formylglycine-generating enzyme required for sulfatase activity
VYMNLSAGVLARFLGEFENEILLGSDGELRRIAEQLRDSFVPLAATDDFRMGAPLEKQGIPEKTREQWKEFLGGEGDPEERAREFMDSWHFLPDGNRWRKDVLESIQRWSGAFRDRDLEDIAQRLFPANETPAQPKRAVGAFLLARWPTVNAWYRLFSPGHGEVDSYYNEKYAEVSPAPENPVIFVSWYDAWAFCKWAHWNGQSCRLPLEYEWEYAAKADTPWDQNYWWGEEFDPNKCNADHLIGRTTPPSRNHANP